MSLQQRLYVLVLLAVLPALAIQAYSGIAAYREREAQIHAEALRLARFTSIEVEHILGDARRALIAMAELPGVRTHDRAACMANAEVLDKDEPELTGFYAIDSTGHMFCASGFAPPGPVQQDFSNAAYFREAKAAGKLVVSTYTSGAPTQMPSLPLALPLFDATGKFDGIVVTGLDLRWLGRFLATRPLPTDGVISMTDRNGTELVHVPAIPNGVGTQMRAEQRWMLTAAQPGATNAVSGDGIERIIGFLPPGATPMGLWVGVGIGKRAAMAKSRAMMIQDIALLILAVGLALLAVALGGRLFIRQPIAMLARAAEQWRGGNLTARAKLPDNTSEIGRLGAAFDDMASALETRARERDALLAQLAGERERLQLVADAIPAQISFIDTEQRYRLVNKCYEGWFGRPRETIVGRHIREVLGEDVYAKIRPQVEAALAGRRMAFEASLPYKDKSRHVAVQYIPASETGEQVAGIYAFVEDIGERKLAETRLRESEARLAAVLETLPLGVGLTDTQGKLVLSNANMRRFAPEVVPARDDLRHGRWRAYHRDGKRIERPEYPAARALRGETVLPGIEFEYAEDDGREIWTRVAAVPMRDAAGQIVGAVALVADITQQKRAEDERRATEERYRLLVESAYDFAIFTMDLDGRINLWNSGAERLLGYKADQIIGTSGAVIFTPEDRAARRPEAEMQAALKEGRSKDERWHLRQDASRFWGSGLLMPLKEEGGAVGGFLKILRDRTEALREEEHRQLLMNELNHRVRNTFAIVQAIAQQTLHNAASTAEANEVLQARLLMLSKAHDVLTRESWKGAELRHIIIEAIGPYRGESGNRFGIEGPVLRLQPKTALAIVMAIHELCTNAAKHGALSNESGHIDIVWKVNRTAVPARFHLRWVEAGGPAVGPPSRRGFGSRLIERGLAQDLGGTVKLDFAPTGVVCTIEAPLDEPAGDMTRQGWTT